jgi:hypothetical protein
MGIMITSTMAHSANHPIHKSGNNWHWHFMLMHNKY